MGSASIFFVRFLLQCNDYLTDMYGNKFANDFDLNRKDKVRFAQVFSATIVLQVFGGGGAIWGFSEAATFRVPATQTHWRHIALTVGAIFFARWLMQAKDFILEARYGDSYVRINRVQMIRLCQVFGAKMVLEVFGGGGAIWGFSEAATFRVPSTQETWRFRALLIGFIFFIRWTLQTIDFVSDIKAEFAKEGIEDLTMKEQPYQNGDSKGVVA